MSHPASSDSEAVASTSLHEKPSEPVVNPVSDVAIFDIDSADLPKGYFYSAFFIGTMTASGLAVTAVSTYPARGTQKKLRLR
jgi:hypothetical protein